MKNGHWKKILNSLKSNAFEYTWSTNVILIYPLLIPVGKFVLLIQAT